MAAQVKVARLHTAKWTQIATVRFVRKDWPRVIMWKGRAFEKGSTGYESEKYVERSVLHATNVVERSQYVKKRL